MPVTVPGCQPLGMQPVPTHPPYDRFTATAEWVADHLDELAGPAEPPARVHGDLWRGNVGFAAGGEPVRLIGLGTPPVDEQSPCVRFEVMKFADTQPHDFPRQE